MSAGARSTKLLLGAVRDALEESLLAAADQADAGEAAERLREAIAVLNRRIEVEPRDVDALDDLDRAAAAMKAAGEALRDDEITAQRIEGAARWLSEASEELRRGLSRQPPGPSGALPSPEMLASVGTPRAHHAGVAAPRVLAWGETTDEPHRPGLALPPAASGEVAQIRAIARDCFEDIASFGSLRRLDDHEPWVDAAPFEQRLLDNLDAVVALERPLDPRAPSLGLVDALFAYATEWTVPDFGRTFALAFTLCCLAPEAAMRWAVLALRRAHPRTYPAFVDAFALGSNEAIDRTLAELCADDDMAIASVALQAMARRGRPDMRSTVLLLARPYADGGGAAFDLAARLPAPAVLPLFARYLGGSQPIAAAHAAAALTSLGDPRGPKHLRELLARPRGGPAAGGDDETSEDRPASPDEERAWISEERASISEDEAARLVAFEALCLLGDPADRDLLLAEARAAREARPWLGWYGAAEHVPLLVATFRRALAVGATHRAIDRIARALERIGGERVPRLGEATREVLEAQVTEWALAFEERRPKDAARLRFGRPWTPLAVVDELEARTTEQRERPVLARELALLTRRAVHVDVEGWVAAQRHALAAARDLLGRV